MIMDNYLEFSVAQALTTGTIVSTNVVDLLNARDIGPGDNVEIPVTVNTAFVGGTSIQATLQESVDNSTWLSVQEGPAVPIANLGAGQLMTLLEVANRPSSMPALPRYLRLQYTIVGTFSAGSVDAGIVLNAPQSIGNFYPAGVTVTN